MVQKRRNAVMLADTRSALVGTVLLQLQQTNPGLFDEAIIYYVEEIPEKDRVTMESIMPCRFIRYSPPLPQSLFEKPRFSRFSVLMFCRYEMFSYLDEFETITWLDTDILVQGDLSDLIFSAKKTGAAFIREDPINKTSENPDYMRTCFTKSLPGFQNDSYLYCSGTIVLSRKITGFQNYTQWCYEKTMEWADILSLPDQGVINASIQAFDIKVTPVSGKKYCCYPGIGRDCSGAKIVHAWGSNKFWNDWYNYQNFPIWRKFYEEWKARGGSPLAFEILPLISVVIPVYKPDLEQLRQCLDSLRNQNRNNWERFSDFEILIIAEPFEQDKLQELAESYHDARIRLIFNEQRLGIAASLNKGIRLAKGKYIARVDDDDICARNRLFLQAQYLQKHPEINLCTSDFEYFGDMNERRVSFEGEMSRAWSIFTCPFNHPTILFDRNFFVENNLFYDETRGYVEDWELWLRAYQKGMQVGCIHEVLYYHRWINAGSAGQTNKTIDMMRELVQKNFQALGVDIPTEDLKIIGPWNGRLLDENDILKLQGYLTQALGNNQLKQLYDQECLERAFSLRMEEAKTGLLPGLSSSTQKKSGGKVVASDISPYKPSWFRRLLKAILKPFYRPIKRRYEDRIIEMQTSIWRSEGHLLNCIAKLDQIIAGQQQQIVQLQKDLELIKLELQTQLSDDVWQTGQYVVSTLSEYEQHFSQSLHGEMENIQQDLSQKLYIEAENTRQELSGKLYTEAENTRQELSGKVYIEAENTRQELSGKVYIEAENTRQELSGKVYIEAENTRQEFSGKLYSRGESQKSEMLDEIHRHIDFTYRDLMIVTQLQSPLLLKGKDIRLETKYPIAYESLDHLYPHGTIRDNTRYPRFIEKCEEIFKSKETLAFMDLGCSGGGMVLDAALKGHVSIGLEGSDYSQKAQRAEWRLLGDCLKTCDITKPFTLWSVDNKIYQFDIITAWEVLEHISEKDLPQLFANIKKHLASTGFFVGSISNWPDIDPVSGENWHVTMHPYDWWKVRFEEFGFRICSNLFDAIDLARGGYNPPHCYEKPYPEYDPQKTFHIAAQVLNERP